MKRIIIPAIALLLGLTSCNWLERNPKATLAPENYFRDETDLQLFSNSFYNNLLPKEPFESAAIDGASRSQSFFRLTIPMMMPTLL